MRKSFFERETLARVLLIVFLFSACLPFGGCSKGEPKAPIDDGSNPYLEQINTNAQSVNVQLPWSRGVNFSQWFEATSPSSINFLRYSEQDFIDAKNMGVEVIRVPIRFHDMAGGAPTYTLDTEFLKKLDIVVGWAEKHEMYLILDNHSWSPTDPTDERIVEVLVPIWRQIATRYKDTGDYIIYELKNEPHGISGQLWTEIQGEVLSEVKAIDSTRSVIVTGTDFGSIGGMVNLPIYSFENVIYSFHFYDPYIFTHQGETWAEPPRLSGLRNIPFPADAHEMPSLPSEYVGTWIEQAFKDYRNTATVQALEGALDQAVKFANQHNVAIFCGEFGVYMPNAQQGDRVRWYEITVRLLEVRAISRTSWDYYGSFGIFKMNDASGELNVPIVKALGLTPPEQDFTPIAQSFVLYDRAPNTQLVRFNAPSSRVDAYAPTENDFVLEWGGAAQYGYMEMVFRRKVDWQSLLEGGYKLSLRVRAQEDVSFQVRFINTELEGLLPWRRAFDVDLVAADGWTDVSVALSQMQVTGAWSSLENLWVLPHEREDGFDWNRVFAIQVVAEQAPLPAQCVLFEYIKIEAA